MQHPPPIIFKRGRKGISMTSHFARSATAAWPNEQLRNRLGLATSSAIR
jgi:hypothetical protein